MEGFSMPRFYRNHVDLFSPDEHAVLANWLGVRPPKSAKGIDPEDALVRLGFESVAGLCLPLPTKPKPSGSVAACRDGRRASYVHKLTFVSGHFKDYQRLGDAAIKVIGDFTPLVELRARESRPRG
jgi:hypothetical protein